MNSAVIPVLLILFTYSEKIFSKTLYEQCDWTNKQYTDNLIEHSVKFQEALEASESEAGYCRDDCQSRKLLINVESHDWKLFKDTFKGAFENDIPSVCFYAGMTRYKNPGTKNYFYCQSSKESEGRVRWMPFVCEDSKRETGCELTCAPNKKINKNKSPRKACLNKGYVELTARAFNQVADCFGFSNVEKIQLFSLFNHESSFHVNVRSPTGARCYGQFVSTP